MKVDLSNVVPLPEGFTIEAYPEKTGTFWVMKGGRCFITIDTVERVWRWGASVVLAYIAATRGTAFAEKAMLAASDLAAADELAAIIVNHASRSPSVEALQACAAEVLAWAERGN